MVDNMNDEDIVDEVFEEMKVDIIEEVSDESSDEDHVLSTNSNCISDCSDDLTEISEKMVTTSQINALNRGTKECAIYFYYSTKTIVIDSHDAINDRYCSNCRNPLFFIFPCNTCPICIQ